MEGRWADDNNDIMIITWNGRLVCEFANGRLVCGYCSGDGGQTDVSSSTFILYIILVLVSGVRTAAWELGNDVLESHLLKEAESCFYLLNTCGLESGLGDRPRVPKGLLLPQRATLLPELSDHCPQTATMYVASFADV